MVAENKKLIVLTDNGREIPSQSLSNGATVTDSISEFRASVCADRTGLGMVNLGFLLDADEVALFDELLKSQDIEFYCARNRLDSLHRVGSAGEVALYLERADEGFFWVRRGSSFESLLEIAQKLEEVQQELESVRERSAAEVENQFGSSSKFRFKTVPERLLRKTFRKISPILPDSAKRFSIKYATIILNGKGFRGE